jgi:hypothetical protein
MVCWRETAQYLIPAETAEEAEKKLGRFPGEGDEETEERRERCVEVLNVYKISETMP